ncbi:MAG: hypothetical protein HQK53_11695 [Oligoflexia bacterium]|nr:hypothetical protein [Oligoflexia bacterium]
MKFFRLLLISLAGPLDLIGSKLTAWALSSFAIYKYWDDFLDMLLQKINLVKNLLPEALRKKFGIYVEEPRRSSLENLSSDVLPIPQSPALSVLAVEYFANQ